MCQKSSRCQERWGLLRGESSVLSAELPPCLPRPVSSPVTLASQERDPLLAVRPLPSVLGPSHYSLHSVRSTYLCRPCHLRAETPICHCSPVLPQFRAGDPAATPVKYGLCAPSSDMKGVLQETHKTQFILYFCILRGGLPLARKRQVLRG